MLRYGECEGVSAVWQGERSFQKGGGWDDSEDFVVAGGFFFLEDSKLLLRGIIYGSVHSGVWH